MNKPKITFVIKWLRSGGAEKQLLLIAENLAKNGFLCEVICLSRTIPHDKLESFVNDASKAGVVINRPFINNYFRIITIIIKLAFKKQCLVWTWGIRSDIVGRISLLLNGKNILVISLRSAYADKIRKERIIRKWIDNSVLAYVSNSSENIDLLHKHGIGLSKQTYILHNTVELASCSKYILLPKTPPSPLKIVMLGHLKLPVKGYDLVIKIFQILQNKKIPCVIYIAGRNDNAHSFLRELKVKGLMKQIVYVGATHNPIEHLRKGHLFLMTSRAEGMPNSLLEAMSLGLPCVTTNVGDVSSLFTDYLHIRIADIDNIQQIANIIEELYNNWFETRKMAMRGQSLCQKKFSQNRINNETLNIIQNILKK